MYRIRLRAASRALFWLLGFLVLTFWVGSMAWLRTESRARAPAYVRPTAYGSLIPSSSLHLTYQIWADRDSIGSLAYAITPEGETRHIRWGLHLALRTGAPQSRVHATGSSLIDSAGVLTSFDAHLTLGPERLDVAGTRDGDVLTIRYSGFGVTKGQVMQVDSTLAVGDGFFPGLVGGCPDRDERLIWSVFDPLTLGTSEVSMEQARGRISPPAPKDGCVLSVTYKGLRTLMWVDADGLVVRQRTPVGWELILDHASKDPRPGRPDVGFPEASSGVRTGRDA